MSGHSHWASIKHKKGATDKKRGKLFSKIARAIQIAAKEGGGKPDANLRLQYAIDEAKAANMPRDNIDRSIKRGTGELEGVTYEAVSYEGYGPGGVAFMAEGLSDNKNRTADEVRKIFENNGGKLAGSNSVAFQFQRKGVITILTSAAGEDQMMEDVLNAGAENMETQGDAYFITCSVTDFEKVKKELHGNYELQLNELTMIPDNLVKVDEANGKKALAIFEALDENEDIQKVYANFDIPDTLVKSE